MPKERASHRKPGTQLIRVSSPSEPTPRCPNTSTLPSPAGATAYIVTGLSCGYASLEAIPAGSVDIMKLYTPRGSEFYRIKLRRAVEPLLIYVGHHEERGLAVGAVEHIVDARQPHRADSRQQSQLAAVPYPHFVPVCPGGRVVAGVHSADYAGKRFRKGCGKETWPFSSYAA